MFFVFTGPECTAKTSLSLALSQQLGMPWQAEIAREYLLRPQKAGAMTDETTGEYGPDDLLNLVRLQQQAEHNLDAKASRPSVLDTDLLTLIVWWQEKYGALPADFSAAWEQMTPRLYLLCEPDIAWQADPLRENPTDRGRLFECYQRELARRQCDYSVVSGQGEARVRCARSIIERALSALN